VNKKTLELKLIKKWVIATAPLPPQYRHLIEAAIRAEIKKMEDETFYHLTGMTREEYELQQMFSTFPPKPIGVISDCKS